MKPITGKFQNAQGSPLVGGRVYLKLSNDAVALGSSQITTSLVYFTLDNAGSIPTGSKLWFNDELTPSGTTYSISVVDSGGFLAWGVENAVLSGSSFNLNSAIPSNSSTGITISAVLTNPSGPQTISGQGLTLDNNAPLTLQSTLAVAGAASFSSNVVLASTAAITWGSSGLLTPDVFVERTASSTLSFGSIANGGDATLNFGIGILPTTGAIQWGATPDTTISRKNLSPGVVQIGTTSANALGTLLAATVNATTYQVGGVALAASNLSNGVTGSGAVVLATSPTLTTPNIGAATGTSLSIGGILAVTGSTGLGPSGTGGVTAGGFGTPSVIRHYLGDGTGWRVEFAKRTASVDTVEAWITDGGVINAGTGFQVNGAASSGNVLRGNGSNFVSSQLAAADLSNGATGSGAVVLATSPTIAGMNVTGDVVVSSANHIEWGSSGLTTPDLFFTRTASSTLGVGSIAGGTDGTLGIGIVSFGTNGAVQWNADTTISRKSLSPGVVQIGTTSANASGTLIAATINAGTGFQVASAAPSGNVLRGNGTNFVSSALAAADLSNGVTGSGAVVLATNPTLAGATFTSLELLAAQGTATSGGNFASNTQRWNTSWWNGTSAVTEVWDLNASPGSGTNPSTSAFQLIHGAGIPNATVAYIDNNVATSGANFNPPSLSMTGHFWNGTASTADVVSLSTAYGAGTNPTATLSVTHTGSSGAFTIDMSGASILKAATVNATSGYQVNGVALAAANLSNGVTGSGAVVLATSPTLTTPNIGTATATTVQGLTGQITPNAAGGINVGTAALPFSGIFIGAAATNNIRITGTATAARTFTLPDANSNPVQPATAAAHQFATAISSAGVITFTQPAAADLSNGVTGSGAVVLATSPALTTPSFSSIVNTGTLTLPTSTDTLVGRATTDTLTNKRITARVQTAADATSITPTSDTADITVQTNTQVSGTLTLNAPTGTPTDGQQLLIRIKSTNSQTYSFNATYAFSTSVTAPTTLAAGKTDYIGCMWNATNSKWDVVAVDQGH